MARIMKNRKCKIAVAMFFVILFLVYHSFTRDMIAAAKTARFITSYKWHSDKLSGL
ncbi:hypothetical protein HMPREF3293_01080 [Christensenella minuta]|uniref:Uncharacterized protein n=1 Tax=Christensenella minuta TaxID=626937 RepID=A0A136Q5Y2_9FIRM|nr:hypothetical protein HMPREF3293_01080 [Christensenella minuta]